ncbi:MAG TPA: hypothetical protein VJQ57_04395 [Acidimicrobiia bacterium]|nr:hypothetical protein [Acidimicrobiia bacterium]
MRATPAPTRGAMARSRRSKKRSDGMSFVEDHSEGVIADEASLH